VADTIHIRPTAPLAERVLLPGDPGVALLLSQSLLGEPKMFNHTRGLWGYTGTAADGHPLTIQSTGIGGPSAATVMFELHRLGARRLLQVGTCAALDRTLELGQLLIADRVLAGDGASRSLGAASVVAPAAPLLAALIAGADGSARQGLVVSCDLLYAGLDQPAADWVAAGARAVEMQTATVFTVARRLGAEAGAVLIVSDRLPPGGRIAEEALVEAEQRAGTLAAAALA
jgi:uridine phosphorylase